MADYTHNDMATSDIRRQFYALRNGLIADTLRKGGLPQKYIFGLQIPQIKEIAMTFSDVSYSEKASIARTLWKDRDCREARLLACHLMPSSEFKSGEDLQWAQDIASREEADILAFRLLRFLANAHETADTLASSDNPLHKYCATAIERFFD